MSARDRIALSSAPTKVDSPAKRKLTAEERQRLFTEAKSRTFETHGEMLEALAKL